MQQSTREFKALLWMLGTIICFCSMAICIRELSDTHSAFDIQFLRNSFCILILLIIYFYKKNINLHTKQTKNNVYRNIFHFIGQSGWTWGLTVLPLSTVFSIEFTMPIWASIIAVIFLKERMNVNKIIFLILGLFGTLIILSPNKNSINEYAIIVLFAAIAYAIAHNLTKILTKTDSIISILFWMSILQLPLSLVGAFIYGGIKIPYIQDFPLIITFAITSLCAHLCLANSLKLADATFVLPLDYIRLPVIAFLGWYIYNENITINIVVGSLLIIISSLTIIKSK